MDALHPLPSGASCAFCPTLSVIKALALDWFIFRLAKLNSLILRCYRLEFKNLTFLSEDKIQWILKDLSIWWIAKFLILNLILSGISTTGFDYFYLNTFMNVVFMIFIPKTQGCIITKYIKFQNFLKHDFEFYKKHKEKCKFIKTFLSPCFKCMI